MPPEERGQLVDVPEHRQARHLTAEHGGVVGDQAHQVEACPQGAAESAHQQLRGAAQADHDRAWGGGPCLGQLAPSTERCARPEPEAPREASATRTAPARRCSAAAPGRTRRAEQDEAEAAREPRPRHAQRLGEARQAERPVMDAPGGAARNPHARDQRQGEGNEPLGRRRNPALEPNQNARAGRPRRRVRRRPGAARRARRPAEAGERGDRPARLRRRRPVAARRCIHHPPTQMSTSGRPPLMNHIVPQATLAVTGLKEVART